MVSKHSIHLDDLRAQYNILKKDFDAAFSEVSQNASFIKGKSLEEFERKFASFLGAKYCIGVASGTDALYLALLSLGIGDNDEVLLPVNTFVATAYSILYTKAKPIFVEMHPQTYNIDVKKIEKAITRKTKAIIPVHLYGQPAQMDEIMKIAKKHNLAVIEDTAQAHGAKLNGKYAGTYGDVGAFSFYPSKNLGAFGDGGAIVTNNSKIAKDLIKLREYGSTRKYMYDKVGLNSRLDTLQAKILSIKLKYLEKWNKKRNLLAEYYTERIQNELPFIVTPSTAPLAESVYHLYVIQVPKRNQLIRFLEKKGIQTGIHYPIPLHLQKSLAHLGYTKGDFPITEDYTKRILSLPMYPFLMKQQQDLVIDTIKKFYKK
jgi:dTDP-4-amino-4,6-dideoxygalactose transaminase